MSHNAAHAVSRMRTFPVFLAIIASVLICGSSATADETLQDAVRPKVAPAETKLTVGDKVPTVAAKDVEEPTGKDMLANGLAKDWKHFSAKEGVSIDAVWQLAGTGDDRQLICTGDPKGFLYTKKAYANFILTFEWTVADADANSGVLIYTQEEPRLWPTSMQVQLHQPQAGDIFPSGDAEGNTTQAPPELAGEVGKWNKCRVESMNGKLSVVINGRKAGEVSGCKPSSGFIALQSEGSRTKFRRLMLRELEQLPEATNATTTEQSVEKSAEPVKPGPTSEKAAG